MSRLIRSEAGRIFAKRTRGHDAAIAGIKPGPQRLTEVSMCDHRINETTARPSKPKPKWHTRREVEAMILHANGPLCADARRILGMLDRAGVFKPEELANGLYTVEIDGEKNVTDHVLWRLAGEWRWPGTNNLVHNPTSIRPLARLEERPLDV